MWMTGIAMQKTFLESSTLVRVAEESNNCANETFGKDSSFSDELSYNNNKVETGSFAFDFDSLKLVPSTKK